MQLAIVLVVALNIFGVQSGCFHYHPAWGWQYSSNHRNYHCVQQDKCFDNQYNLTPKQKRVTQNGRCIIHGTFDFGQVCCHHRSPAPRKSPNSDRRTPTRNPTVSLHIPNRRQQSQPEQHISTQISPQAPLRPQSLTSSPISSSQNANCKCIQKNRCRDRQVNNFQFTQVICPNTNEICCRNFFQPLSSSTINQSPQPKPPRPSLPSTKIPTRAPSFRPATQGPSQISTQVTISNIAPQPRPPRPSQIFPLKPDCTCTPFFRCYDDETSSNLTGVVDDRTFTQQSCPSPNEICCHNLVPPSSTNANCNCIPTSECYDHEISSNPAGLFDVQNNNRPLRQESCANSNHVCCHHLVKPLSTPTRKPSTQPLSPSPSQISNQRPTVVQSPLPLSPSPAQISTQRPTVVQSPLPLSPSPAQSTSQSTNCLCTPFYKCYDEETSSNLTGVVDDRSFIPVAEQRTCSDPNEICCYNLVKPVIKPHTVSSSEDCSGSCVPIQECPNLSNILNEASSGKSDAIQELRSLVCSVTDGRALVCCHQKGPKTRNNPFGVIFQNN